MVTPLFVVGQSLRNGHKSQYYLFTGVYGGGGDLEVENDLILEEKQSEQGAESKGQRQPSHISGKINTSSGETTCLSPLGLP